MRTRLALLGLALAAALLTVSPDAEAGRYIDCSVHEARTGCEYVYSSDGVCCIPVQTTCGPILCG